MTPIKKLVAETPLEELPAPESVDELPYATHSGRLNIGGVELEVFQLSNGQRVIGGKFLEEMMEALKF